MIRVTTRVLHDFETHEIDGTDCSTDSGLLYVYKKGAIAAIFARGEWVSAVHMDEPADAEAAYPDIMPTPQREAFIQGAKWQAGQHTKR